MNAAPLIACKIPLPAPLPPVLGTGAFLKNALCLIQGQEAWISREVGSLDSLEAIHAFQETAQDLLSAAAFAPIAVAHDRHPDFYATRWALESGLPPLAIQHHHAHIAAVMAEHGLEEPVLGLALDGFGLGDNDESWGGELLLVDGPRFQRLGHLYPLPQPGGDRAAREPWRMGAAALWSLGRGAEIAARYAGFTGAGQLALVMDKGLNAPMTSSAGRLFDAACGLLGVKILSAFEGEAPMELERIAAESGVESILIDSSLWRIDSSLILDMRPLLETLSSRPLAEGAALFHAVFAGALLDWTLKAAPKTGIRKIALGGGCFFNKLLRDGLTRGMIASGLTPLFPKALPVGDTALALGQAYAAALSLRS